MSNSNKRILFLAPYPVDLAPSQRLKYEQYYDHFKGAGFKIHTSSFVSNSFWRIIYKPKGVVKKIYFTLLGYIRRTIDLFSIHQYDIVYVHLWVTPLGPPIFEWLVSKLSKKLIYDIDDLIYLGDTSKNNLFIKALKGKNKPIYLMKHADEVIVCTPKLEEFVNQYNQNTTDISSTIDTDSYQPVNDYKNTDKIVLGWSGSHSTSKYLYILQGVLLKLAKKHDFKLLVIGDASFKIRGLDCETIAWSREKEIDELQRIDIGLYPLPDEEWVYGKSGLKALQYMALGIPTVATAIGANYRVIEEGVSGYLVTSEDEWVNRLSALIINTELRKKIGEKARVRVENLYSVNANKNTYIGIFEKLTNN